MIDIHRILCPVDFSEPSRRALAHAVTLARWYRARLTVLHAYHVMPLAPMAPEMSPALALPAEVREQLRGELERFAEPAGADAVPVEFAVVEGSAAREILRRAQDDPTDLIVIGTHGRSGFERFMLGSVTEKILHRASCAVLTIPAVRPAPHRFRSSRECSVRSTSRPARCTRSTMRSRSRRKRTPA